MCSFHDSARFVKLADAPMEMQPWGRHLWYARPGLCATNQLLVVQVDMPPGTGHQFHKHPGREEVLYVIEGSAEQWVEQERKLISGGDGVFIPAGAVHGIFNDSEKMCRFLAILSPATCDEPLVVDVYAEKPWCDLRVKL